MGQLITMSMTSISPTAMIDVGSTTRIEPPERAPVASVIQFLPRATNRGEQFRSEYQKMYDEGIQIALKYLGGGGAAPRYRGA